MISLENLQGFPLKSSAVLSHMNPPKIPINSAGNLLKIPEESTPKIPLKSISTWILSSLAARLSVWLPFHQVSAIHLPAGLC